MSGIGTIEFCNNQKYIGNFEDGKIHGLGTFYSEDEESIENTISGEWNNNKL